MYRMRNHKSTGIRLLNKDEIQMYFFGGKGKFILKSTKTEKSYEYKIKPMAKVLKVGYGKPLPNPNYDENILYISVKGDFNYIFLGCIKIEENKYLHSKKSPIDESDAIVKGIKWLLNQFEIDKDFPSEMEFHHLGTCGCCAKTLTTEGSIKLGIGPICFERYGSERLKKLLVIKKKMEKRMRDNKIIL
jgi:hypothetical protein